MQTQGGATASAGAAVAKEAPPRLHRPATAHAAGHFQGTIPSKYQNPIVVRKL